jgi:hypothetical protein
MIHMNNFDTYGRFLDSVKAQKARAKASEDEGESESVSPNIALLKRVQRIVFGPNVTDLAEAKTRLASLIDALDDEETETKKKTAKPTE